MNTDTEGLARMAGFFSAEEIDRDDCPVQHSQFADQCALAIAASMVVACGIGMTWCFAAWPGPDSRCLRPDRLRVNWNANLSFMV